MPILKPGELDILSHSAAQTQRLGQRLGEVLRPGDVVCLSGDMGAGKTVFATGIGQGWGSTLPLTSPTYNLVHQHRRAADDQLLYHLDCYRLQDEEESATIGLDDLFDGRAIVLIEWAERVEGVLPPTYLWVEIRLIEETRRNFILEPKGAHYQQLIDRFRQKAFGY